MILKRILCNCFFYNFSRYQKTGDTKMFLKILMILFIIVLIIFPIIVINVVFDWRPPENSKQDSA
ncbi:MAG: hypothetical protein A2812_02105 [Candidatus Staskawiczbacteria bacterium RIFCSPHIGHO2_01_FULL_36_16]|uniref:Uncharacterized protein n=1 Tax=Candidatus Staskawiczbacteria bacterium RIFCSPHIGHO2_01_FULL_36_16 TaxID=1802200 RepID=A0A1G2HNE5_9BACT|nr:MAG: hypothetical protein A2812_02105 [Candidatus Staskawiczbacteria bacterium RIFCSPHIGHO2_01_FULL_36_16]